MVPTEEYERGALVARGFYGLLGRLKPYLTGLILLLVIQTTMVVLRFAGYFPLSLIVLLFTIFTMLFESMIMAMAYQKVSRNVTPHVGMIWTGGLDWDLYENGILTKRAPAEGPGTIITAFVPFNKMARVFIFPRGQTARQVFELYQDRQRFRDGEKPAAAEELTPATAAVISNRVWFFDQSGKLMDLTMVKNELGSSGLKKFRELLRDRVKVEE
jgi:hypothetical protein